MKQYIAPVHTLEVPTTGVSLLVPSATVAEVVNVPQLMTPLPQSPQWCHGVFGWRSKPVPVISFEALLGENKPWVGPRSKILVFFPIPGRPERDFFGILAASEPQPQNIEYSPNLQATPPKQSKFIASAVNLHGRVAVIPNMQAFKEVFYS